MYKVIVFLSTFLTVFNATASSPKIKTCSTSELTELASDIKEWKTEHKLTEVYLILNVKKEILGFYSANKNGSDMYAKLCDYFEAEDATVSNHWYYWEGEGSSIPTTWKKGYQAELVQDEGKAFIKVLTNDRNSQMVTAEFSVIGWKDSRKNITFAKDTILLQRKNK